VTNKIVQGNVSALGYLTQEMRFIQVTATLAGSYCSYHGDNEGLKQQPR
jgi:hypothetical protein